MTKQLAVTDSQYEWMLQLRGCNVARIFDTKNRAERAIHYLSHCELHGGIHHFGVFGEGRGIAMSYDGWECLENNSEGVLDV